jgi:hypothetical protein
MTRKHDGKSKLSSAGTDSDSGAGRERKAFWAGWRAAQEAETNYGCKVENLAPEAKTGAFELWQEAEAGNESLDELHPGDAQEA